MLGGGQNALMLRDCGDGMNLNGLQSAISSSYANEGTKIKQWT